MMNNSKSSERRDLAQATLALACLAAAVIFSLFGDSGRSSITRQAVTPHALSDEEIYTGSILFMPYQGNDCRQNLLDNLTGQIRENGVVPCDSAILQTGSKQARAWSAARVDAIRDGFARR
jgi:hypothetical protein